MKVPIIDGRPCPPPSTPEEFQAAYRENLREANIRLRDAMDRVQAMKRADLIFRVPKDESHSEMQVICKGQSAKNAWGDLVRASSDVDHWQRCLSEACAAGFGERLKRMPRVKDGEAWLEPAFAGDDDGVPF